VRRDAARRRADSLVTEPMACRLRLAATMDGWLTNLVEPLYGIVDLFLDRPFAALLTTSVAGALFAAMVLSLR
jgi:hypothetical protein